MNAFVVEVKNQPGEMARVTEALAARGVNLLVSCFGIGDQFAVAFVANDDDRARSALTDSGESFREIPFITVRTEDVPGQAAAASRKLADAGINIELWLPVDTSRDNFTVAIGADNLEKARQVLSDQITEFNYS
jgi:hypothetical protein